mmetsp:Transcript_80929/g.249721  ORF Transcript_80929/g.249721 Transcript_80929/m.249721 type:complete len:236 (-) Transcript_80929:89-796(-)
MGPTVGSRLQHPALKTCFIVAEAPATLSRRSRLSASRTSTWTSRTSTASPPCCMRLHGERLSVRCASSSDRLTSTRPTRTSTVPWRAPFSPTTVTTRSCFCKRVSPQRAACKCQVSRAWSPGATSGGLWSSATSGWHTSCWRRGSLSSGPCRTPWTLGRRSWPSPCSARCATMPSFAGGCRRRATASCTCFAARSPDALAPMAAGSLLRASASAVPRLRRPTRPASCRSTLRRRR